MSDLVSRQQVIDVIEKWYEDAENNTGIIETIKQLPSIPQTVINSNAKEVTHIDHVDVLNA